MNSDLEQQTELFNSLLSRFNRDSFWNLKDKGHVHYIMNNEIASWSLYNDEYFMTDKAEELIVSRGFDVSKTHTRTSIFNIRSNGNGQGKGTKLATFEHMVPASVQFGLIKSVYGEKGEVISDDLHNILHLCGKVVVMTKDENRLLVDGKLNQAMPDSWNLGDNPIVRYTQVGIKLSNNILKVKGRMMR
jgi:hypothetical protein